MITVPLEKTSSFQSLLIFWKNFGKRNFPKILLMLLFSISKNIPTLGISKIGILLEVHVKGFLKAFNSEFVWNSFG